jgi:glycosyltransferase involved in cell wall biosynthesis
LSGRTESALSERTVLLVCPEPLGHGRPAGVGIRFIELARVLQEAGFRTHVLSPDGAAPESSTAGPLSPESIRDASLDARVAIVQGHAANDFFAHAAEIPTAIDLYDPYLIENLSYSMDDEQIFVHDWTTMMRSLANGDFFLCASRRQRAFYLGLLTAAGRVNPASFSADPTLDGLIDVVPFGVPPARPIPEKDLSAPRLLFGGIYDWYDPILAIDAVVLAARTIPSLSLTFVSHPNAATTPQSKYAHAVEHVRKLGLENQVRFSEWFSYLERAAIYDQHAAAIMTFPRSIETELSYRTRLLDYLWGGLPVLTSSAAGTDEILSRYGADIVLGSDPRAVADRIVATLGDPALYRAMVEGTQRFVVDHQWRDLARPLVEFCRHPRTDSSRAAWAPLGSELTLPPPSRARKAVRKLRRLLRR